jgi:hypothetical protein
VAAPAARFTLSPVAPAAGHSSTSSDADGDPLALACDLEDDGAFDDGTATTATTSFGISRPQKVSLEVTDPAGPPVVRCETVLVANAPPSAALRASPQAPGVGETVTYRSTLTDGDGTTALTRWDLDNDGPFDDATGTTTRRASARACGGRR